MQAKVSTTEGSLFMQLRKLLVMAFVPHCFYRAGRKPDFEQTIHGYDPWDLNRPAKPSENKLASSKMHKLKD